MCQFFFISNRTEMRDMVHNLDPTVETHHKCVLDKAITVTGITFFPSTQQFRDKSIIDEKRADQEQIHAHMCATMENQMAVTIHLACQVQLHSIIQLSNYLIY